MDILGSIDNASLKSSEGKKTVCHIIVTSEKLIVVRVLDRHKEIIEHPAEGSNFGGGTRGSYFAAQMLQKQMIDDAYKRGKEIENNLDDYMKSNPEGLEMIPYDEITKAVLSKGTLFSLPGLKVFTNNGEFDFRLIHNNFAKSGKLDPETFSSYSDPLRKALGEKLEIK